MEYVNYLHLYAKTLYHNLISNKKKHHKCLIFNEEEETDFDFFEYAPDMTIEEIQKKIRLKKYKIEIRYIVHGRKYRIVVRENENIHFPIRKELGLMKPNIESASLLIKDNGGECDVTERIRKYFGQNKDFNSGLGLKIFVQDMFPFDDHEDNAERFGALYIRMSDGTEYYFDYTKNTEIIL